MHYIFFDESWQKKELWIPTIIAPQASYNERIRTVKFRKRKDRVVEINTFLKEVDGYGILCRVQLEDEWLTEKTTDSCADISRMSRINNVWSWSVAHGIIRALIQAEKKRQSFSAVDIHHDPKTLTSEHRKVFHELLRKNLTRMLKEAIKKGFGFGFKNLKIRRIEDRKKADKLPMDKLQSGVWMADQLAKHADRLDFSRFSNLQINDATPYIKNTVRRWKDRELL